MNNYSDLPHVLSPLWEGDVAFCESVMFVAAENGDVLPKRLLYTATEIIDVSSATLETHYEYGRDYSLENGCLVRADASRIPVQSHAKMFPETPVEGHSFPKTGGGNIYFSEGDVFHRWQVVVTYRHQDAWPHSVPKNKKNLLPATNKILEAGGSLSVLFTGDSITEGANSSGPIGAPPHLPSWRKLISSGLERRYGVKVPAANVSMGGQISAWGAEKALKAAQIHAPNLLVVAFGMNDGSHKVPVAVFKANIQSILDIYKGRHPAMEAILVASIEPNPNARDFVGYQQENAQALLELEGPGVAVADVNALHRALMQTKAYEDMTGNNVNHLNDYTARMQAQVVLQTIGI